MDEIRIVGREVVDGRPTIILSFEPKPGFKPVTEGGKVIQKLSGQAWIDEEDRQLVRLEARLLDTLGVGPIRVARLQKGASAYFQRRKVNGEIWLPSEARFTGAAKALLVFEHPRRHLLGVFRLQEVLRGHGGGDHAGDGAGEPGAAGESPAPTTPGPPAPGP